LTSQGDLWENKKKIKKKTLQIRGGKRTGPLKRKLVLGPGVSREDAHFKKRGKKKGAWKMGGVRNLLWKRE